jgi:hypothetical protein
MSSITSLCVFYHTTGAFVFFIGMRKLHEKHIPTALEAVLVPPRRMSLRGETGPFAECTPEPHLSEWTGSFAEHIYKVLITLHKKYELLIHY